MSKLISLFRSKGSDYRFEELIAPHIAGLYRQAHQYTGSVDDAEDLLQELLIQLHHQSEKMEAIEQLKPWLMRCLYHRFVDGYRKKLRQPPTSDIDAWDSHELPVDPARAESLRIQQEINRALHTLSPAQRAVVCLHDIEGYSLPELVETLGQPLGTLKSNLHRARRKLKNQLEVQPSADAERVNSKRQ